VNEVKGGVGAGGKTDSAPAESHPVLAVAAQVHLLGGFL